MLGFCRFLRVAYWVSWATLLLVGGAMKVDASKVDSASVAGVLSIFQQQYSVYAILGLGGMVGLFRILGTWASHQLLGPAVSVLLEQAYEFAYKPKVKRQEPHLHRVALFRRTRWGKRLINEARSGHITQRGRTWFHISDDPKKCEGIAGKTWVSSTVIVVNGLPDVSRSPTEDKVRIYAESGNVSPDWVRKKSPTARSFLGMPVEVRGRLWGVLVFDSADPDPFRYDEHSTKDKAAYNFISVAFGKLLERGYL